MSAADIPDLRVGPVVLALRSRWSLTQTYSELRAEEQRRAADGSLYIRRAWAGKLRTEISGEGKLPLALAQLDTSSPVTLACASPRHIAGDRTTITLPSTRRSGAAYAPLAWAIVDGDLVSTTVSITDDVATCGTVSGADAYQVAYWPHITAHITRATETLTTSSGQHSYRWQLIAEEV